MYWKIVKSDSPFSAKRLSKKVEGFDKDVWNERAVEIATRVIMYLINGRIEARMAIRDTIGKVLAEELTQIIAGKKSAATKDGSTKMLLARIGTYKKA